MRQVFSLSVYGCYILLHSTLLMQVQILLNHVCLVAFLAKTKIMSEFCLGEEIPYRLITRPVRPRGYHLSQILAHPYILASVRFLS